MRQEQGVRACIHVAPDNTRSRDRFGGMAESDCEEMEGGLERRPSSTSALAVFVNVAGSR